MHICWGLCLSLVVPWSVMHGCLSNFVLLQLSFCSSRSFLGLQLLVSLTTDSLGFSVGIGEENLYIYLFFFFFFLLLLMHDLKIFSSLSCWDDILVRFVGHSVIYLFYIVIWLCSSFVISLLIVECCKEKYVYNLCAKIKRNFIIFSLLVCWIRLFCLCPRVIISKQLNFAE